MIPVRQSTAFETAIGPILDADGVAVTDAVVGDFTIKKTTGNFAALNGSATLTHVSAGFYDLVLTTSDVDTVGLNCVAIDDGTNTCAPLYLQVIEEAVYDAFYAASALGYVANAPVNVAQFGGSNGTFASGRPEVNMTHIAGSVVSTSTAQLGVNVVNFGGLAGTFANGLPAVNTVRWASQTVLTPTVTGVPRVDVEYMFGDANASNGLQLLGLEYDANQYVSGNLVRIGGDAQSATDLKDFADAGYNPVTHKVAGVVLVDTLTTYTGNTPQTADHTANITAILADTNELQTDWVNGGRLDNILDARSSQTSVDDLPTNAELATALGTADDAVLAYLGANVGALGANLSAIPKTGYKLASDGLDSIIVEGSISASAALTNDTGTQLTSINGRQALALIASACGAVLAGAATTNMTFKPAGNSSGNNRIDATVTADGNRTAVNLKVPD